MKFSSFYEKKWKHIIKYFTFWYKTEFSWENEIDENYFTVFIVSYTILHILDARWIKTFSIFFWDTSTILLD